MLIVGILTFVSRTGFRLGGVKPQGCDAFFMSTQLDMGVEMLICTRIAKIKENFRVKSQKLGIYPADEC